jgi:hypothetical protein
VQRDTAKCIVLRSKQRAEMGPAQVCGARQHGLEHRLQVARRAGDHAQDVRGCRLLFQCLCELARARLQLLEQPRILDGDHSLVGECLEQLDLPFGEPPRYVARYCNCSNRPAVLSHRHGDRAPDGLSSHSLARGMRIIGIRADIGNLLDAIAKVG